MSEDSKTAASFGLNKDQFSDLQTQLGRVPHTAELALHAAFLKYGTSVNLLEDVVIHDAEGKNISRLPNTAIVFSAKNPSFNPKIEEATFDVESVPFPKDLTKTGINLLSDHQIVNHLNSIYSNQRMIDFKSAFQDIELRILHTLTECIISCISNGQGPEVVHIELSIGQISNQANAQQLNTIISGLTKSVNQLDLNIGRFILNVDADEATITMEVSGSIILPTGLDFKYKGDLIFILGECTEDIQGSSYLNLVGTNNSALTVINLQKLPALIKTIHHLTSTGLVNTVAYCSKGGLFVTLTAMSFGNELGFDIVTDAEIREDAFLFGESGGRVLVTVNEDNEDDFIEYMMDSGVSFTLLGHVTQGKMVVDDEHFGFSKEAKKNVVY